MAGHRGGASARACFSGSQMRYLGDPGLERDSQPISRGGGVGMWGAVAPLTCGRSRRETAAGGEGASGVPGVVGNPGPESGQGCSHRW